MSISTLGSLAKIARVSKDSKFARYFGGIMQQVRGLNAFPPHSSNLS